MGLLLPKGDISSKLNSSNYKEFFCDDQVNGSFLCFNSLL